MSDHVIDKVGASLGPASLCVRVCVLLSLHSLYQCIYVILHFMCCLWRNNNDKAGGY